MNKVELSTWEVGVIKMALREYEANYETKDFSPRENVMFHDLQDKLEDANN